MKRLRCLITTLAICLFLLPSVATADNMKGVNVTGDVNTAATAAKVDAGLIGVGKIDFCPNFPDVYTIDKAVDKLNPYLKTSAFNICCGKAPISPLIPLIPLSQDSTPDKVWEDVGDMEAVDQVKLLLCCMRQRAIYAIGQNKIDGSSKLSDISDKDSFGANKNAISDDSKAANVNLSNINENKNLIMRPGDFDVMPAFKFNPGFCKIAGDGRGDGGDDGDDGDGDDAECDPATDPGCGDRVIDICPNPALFPDANVWQEGNEDLIRCCNYARDPAVGWITPATCNDVAADDDSGDGLGTGDHQIGQAAIPGMESSHNLVFTAGTVNEIRIPVSKDDISNYMRAKLGVADVNPDAVGLIFTQVQGPNIMGKKEEKSKMITSETLLTEATGTVLNSTAEDGVFTIITPQYTDEIRKIIADKKFRLRSGTQGLTQAGGARAPTGEVSCSDLMDAARNLPLVHFTEEEETGDERIQGQINSLVTLAEENCPEMLIVIRADATAPGLQTVTRNDYKIVLVDLALSQGSGGFGCTLGGGTPISWSINLMMIFLIIVPMRLLRSRSQ